MHANINHIFLKTFYKWPINYIVSVQFHPFYHFCLFPSFSRSFNPRPPVLFRPLSLMYRYCTPLFIFVNQHNLISPNITNSPQQNDEDRKRDARGPKSRWSLILFISISRTRIAGCWLLTTIINPEIKYPTPWLWLFVAKSINLSAYKHFNVII